MHAPTRTYVCFGKQLRGRWSSSRHEEPWSSMINSDYTVVTIMSIFITISYLLVLILYSIITCIWYCMPFLFYKIAIRYHTQMIPRRYTVLYAYCIIHMCFLCTQYKHTVRYIMYHTTYRQYTETVPFRVCWKAMKMHFLTSILKLCRLISVSTVIKTTNAWPSCHNRQLIRINIM